MQLFVATAERQPEFVLQMTKIVELPPYVGQLPFQAAPHRCAWLEAVPSKSQEASDFAELESQTLHAANKGQSFHVSVSVATETSLGP